jgi:YkoY family integral membrane protein
MPFGIDVHDLITICLLVLLEGALSADNALVLAVLVLPLPPEQQKRALRYGILGAFAFRITSTLFAAYLIDLDWVKLIGALYLLYLPLKHFLHRPDEVHAGKPRAIATMLGLSAFWSTVVRVELTDIVFAIDSILVAVAMSRKLWVIIAGGVLGIIAMRLLIGQLLGIVRRYPAIVDGAYVIVAWVGVKLMIEYLHAIHVIGWEVPRWLSITTVLVLFGISAIYARWKERPRAKRGADKVQDLIDRELGEP